MAAGEDELEALVLKGHLVHAVLASPPVTSSKRVFSARVRSRRMRSIARRRAVVMSHAAGLVGVPSTWPALCRSHEGLLRGFLGELEVAEEADQRSENATPLVAEDPLENGQYSTIGRISIAPPRRAGGSFAASSTAASRSSAS